MTQTSTAAAPAAYHLGHLPADPQAQDFLSLIELCRTELDALEAGMVNQTPEAREIQNRAWSGQNDAMLEVVKAALAAGVDMDAITAITWRSIW